MTKKAHAMKAEGRTLREIESKTGVSRSRWAVLLKDAPEAAQTPPTPAPQPPAQKLVRVARGATAAPSAAEVAPAPPPATPAPEPTVAEIEALDTREEALAILRTIKLRMAGADEVRFGGLAEKALSAINRIEQIDRRRPAPPAPDAVHEAIKAASAEAAAHLTRYTTAAAQRWDRFLPRLRVALGIAAPDLLVELDALLGAGKAA